MPSSQKQELKVASAADELVGIKDPKLGFSSSLTQYVVFLITTWFGVLTSLPYLIMNPFTLLPGVILFASLSSGLMLVLLFVTTLLNQRWVKKLFAPDGVSYVNAPYPGIWKSITTDIKNSAYSTLSGEKDLQATTASKVVFDLEVAKLLMCVAALTYEGSFPKIENEIEKEAKRQRVSESDSNELENAEGGDLLSEAIGITKAEKAFHSVDESSPFIHRTALSELGLLYKPLSFLSTKTSSLSGAFFKRDSDFIILAFKGTNPAEFSEWIIDFTYAYAPDPTYLNGYGGVHKGFYSNIFTQPKDAKGSGVLPYSSICKGIKTIARDLQRHNGGKQIQLWVTGHSLGCGLASAFFARAIQSPNDFGRYDDAKAGRRRDLIAVRDAYLFAAPIFGDYASKKAFNSAIKGGHGKLNKPSMLFRVTNNADIVATGLPQGGDSIQASTAFTNPLNQFNFAHLGTEIKMKAGKASTFGPTLLDSNARVQILSHLKGDGTGPEIKLKWYYNVMEKLPFFGRIVSHGTSFYWRKLNQVQATSGNDQMPYENSWF